MVTGPLSGHVLAVETTVSCFTMATPSAPSYTYDRQGLVPAFRPGCTPLAGGPYTTPEMEGNNYCLPTHPFPLPSHPQGTVGLHRVSQKTWKIQRSPSPFADKFSVTALGGDRPRASDPPIRGPYVARTPSAPTSSHLSLQLLWGLLEVRRCFLIAESLAELEGQLGWRRGQGQACGWGGALGGGISSLPQTAQPGGHAGSTWGSAVCQPWLREVCRTAGVDQTRRQILHKPWASYW